MKLSSKFVKIMAILLSFSLIIGSTVSVLAEETETSEPSVVVSETEATEEETEAETVESPAVEAAEETQTESVVADSEECKAEESSEPSADDATTPVMEETQPAEEPKTEEPAAEEAKAETETNEAEPVQEIIPAKQSGTPVIKGEYTDETKMFYRINITGTVLDSSEFYRVKVWSKPDGTDDAKWTNFKKTEDGYEVLITISDYKSTGYYYAQIYLYKRVESGYENTYIGSSNFSVYPVSKGTLSVANMNKTKGTAQITAEGMTSAPGVVSARAVVYSKSDMSDQYEYAMTMDENGNWTTMIDVANHGGLKGTYKVAVYATDGNGFEANTINTEVSFAGATGSVEVTTDKTNNKYTVTVSDFTSASAVKGLKVALWSETKGQDDLKWHDMTISKAGDSATFSSYLKDFKDLGLINAHVYVVNSDGSEKFLCKTTFTVTPPKATVSVPVNRAAHKFSINVKNLESEYAIESVTAWVWTKSDASDRKTYTLTKTGEDYSISDILIGDFGSIAGMYHVRAFANTKNGTATMLRNTAFTMTETPGTITYTDKITLTYGRMQRNYSLYLNAPVVKNGIAKIEFAVWSENDTSKIKWYTGRLLETGQYYTNVKIADIRQFGQYVTHVYITDQTGKRYCLTGAEIMKVDGTATGTVTLSNCSPAGGTFVVNLKNASAPAGVSNMNVKAWTKSDKSDSYTYSATAGEDGNFSVKVNIANHKYNIGTYHIEVYAVMGNGILSLVGTKDYNFNGKNNVFAYKTSEHHRLIGIDNPTKTTDLKAAIWSEEGGQDDVRWIALSQNGKQWTADLNLAGFLHAGKFNVHFYSGSSFIKATTFTAPVGEAGRTGWVYESGYKFYYEYGVKKTDLTGMVGAPYQICINRQCCTVTVYALDGSNGFIIPVVAFACSVGLPGMETPTGVYYSDYKSRWEMLMGPSWGQYVTHVVEGVYIHSVAGYNTTSYNLSAYDYNNLGQPASHGCIRLNVHDAKWIYDYCPYGTQIYIYDSSWPGPLGKPATIKIPAGQNWDPTDPNI